MLTAAEAARKRNKVAEKREIEKDATFFRELAIWKAEAEKLIDTAIDACLSSTVIYRNIGGYTTYPTGEMLNQVVSWLEELGYKIRITDYSDTRVLEAIW